MKSPTSTSSPDDWNSQLLIKSGASAVTRWPAATGALGGHAENSGIGVFQCRLRRNLGSATASTCTLQSKLCCTASDQKLTANRSACSHTEKTQYVKLVTSNSFWEVWSAILSHAAGSGNELEGVGSGVTMTQKGSCTQEKDTFLLWKNILRTPDRRKKTSRICWKR